MKEQMVKFDNYSIVHLEVSQIPDNFDGKKGELKIETEHHANPDEKKVHKLLIRLKTVTEKSIIDLEVEGYFEFYGEFEDDDIEKFMRINASSILYPYCRAIMSIVTGLDSSQNVLLPIINFANLKKEE